MARPRTASPSTTACDFVSDAFNVTMIHVSGLFNADEAIQAKGEAIAARHFSAADLSSFGRDVHGGVAETSAVLAVRPISFGPATRACPAIRSEVSANRVRVARKPGWPGYFSAPAKASAAFMAGTVEAWWIEGMSDLILQGVRGDNLFGRPRWPWPVIDDLGWAPIAAGVLGPGNESSSRSWRRGFANGKTNVRSVRRARPSSGRGRTTRRRTGDGVRNSTARWRVLLS